MISVNREGFSTGAVRGIVLGHDRSIPLRLPLASSGRFHAPRIALTAVSDKALGAVSSRHGASGEGPYLLDELATAWDMVQRGGRVGFEQRARIRLAAVTAAEHSVQAVDLAYHLGGGSSVFASSPLQRCFRDVHTGSQHVMVSRRMLETIGRWRLGQPIEGSMV